MMEVAPVTTVTRRRTRRHSNHHKNIAYQRSSFHSLDPPVAHLQRQNIEGMPQQKITVGIEDVLPSQVMVQHSRRDRAKRRTDVRSYTRSQ